MSMRNWRWLETVQTYLRARSQLGELTRMREERLLIDSRTRMFEAVTGQDWRARRGKPSSADGVNQHAGTKLRDEARHLDENDGTAIAVLDDLIANIVPADGYRCLPMVRKRNGELAEKVNEQIERWLEKVTAWPETTGELPGAEADRLQTRTWLRDGECFAVEHHGLIKDLPHGLGYLLELQEPDLVPFEQVSIAPSSDNVVIHGVELNRWRRPVAYHFLTAHPANISGMYAYGSTNRVAADRVIHTKLVKRLSQTRGASVLASAITTITDLREAWESERIAMRVAAALTGFIKRDASFAPSAQMQQSVTDSVIGARSFEMTPGMVYDKLLPGEDVGIISSDRPNQNFAPFTDALHRVIAGGTGTRKSAVSRNYDGSYSANRQELVEGVVHYRRAFAYQNGVYVRRRHQGQVMAGILAGAINPRGADMATIYAYDCPPPSLPWIDPKKELEAFGLAVDKQFAARSEIIRWMGRNPREVEARIAREREQDAERAADSAADADPISGEPPADDDDQPIDKNAADVA